MSKVYLKITTQVCQHDASGLFDYSSKSLQRDSITISKSSTIYLSNDICYVPDQEIVPSSIPLIRATLLKNAFQVTCQVEDPERDMWLVVRYTKHREIGYQLKEGDCLKLGKIKFFVKQINTQSLNASENILKVFYEQKLTEKICEEHSQQDVCRICLCDLSSEDNPLVSPCSCSGTMSKIHTGCLKEWLKNKITSWVTSKTMSFYSKDLTCELCKQEIPVLVVHNNKTFSLIDFYSPENSCYVVLEEYFADRAVKHGVHIINLKQNQGVVIGRSPECDLKINDITVSRRHCVVLFNKYGFYVQDRESKFGTLVKMKNPFKASADTDVTIQVDRCSLRIVGKQKCTNCCYKLNNKIANQPSVTLPEGAEGISETAAFVNRLK